MILPSVLSNLVIVNTLDQALEISYLTVLKRSGPTVRKSWNVSMESSTVANDRMACGIAHRIEGCAE